MDPSGDPGGGTSRGEGRPLSLKSEQALLRDVKKLADLYLASTSTRLAGRTPPADGSPGTRLETGRLCTSTNEYVIREKVGEGGMGVVYRAFDQKLKRDVALKALLRTEGDLLERFIREQEMTALLDHPYFVRVLSSGYICLNDRSVPFYTMPLIRGRTLERLVLRRTIRDEEGLRLRREYPVSSLLRMLGQLCLTLQSAHDKHIVHRDLKPSNVLIGPYGDVYVTDLGLAKVVVSAKPKETGYFNLHVMEQLARPTKVDLTQDSMMGTPYYMAPEQGLNPQAVDHRVDIFGLGALLYFILTAQRPQYRESRPDPGKLEARKSELLRELREYAGEAGELADLLTTPKSDLPPDIRLRLEELEEIRGLLLNSEYHLFRRIMKECAIIPPRELVASREDPEGRTFPPVPALEALCMKALAKHPDDRYPSARAFFEAIRRHLEQTDLFA